MFTVSASFKNTGWRRLFRAATYSYRGLTVAVRHESAFRQELILSCVFVPLAFWLNVATVERILMVSSVLLVLIVELLNSSIEAVVDRVGFEKHELAGRAKDMGSAAVFVSLLLWGFVWGSIILS